MGSYNIRLGCSLSFDEQQEADIIKYIEALNNSHKTGQFISNILRLAFDSPEVMSKNNSQYEKGDVIKAMEVAGLSYRRDQQMQRMSTEVAVMKQKVDDMYNMILNTYMLAQMGKHLGLEEKADNELMAQFIIEKQLKELQDTLGITLSSSVFASNKKQDVEKIANDALEYIIESYSGVVNEIKAIVDKSQSVMVKSDMIEQPTVVNQSVTEIQQPVVEAQPQVVASETTVANTEDASEDEFIDFGEADLGALSNFFGLGG